MLSYMHIIPLVLILATTACSAPQDSTNTKVLDSIFKTRGKNAMLKTEDVIIRFIRPDVAIAHVKNEFSGLLNPDGQTLPPQNELSMRVFVKNDGRWQVAAFHNTVIRPLDASPYAKPNR